MSNKKNDVQQMLKEVVALGKSRGWTKFNKPKNCAMDVVSEASEIMEHFVWTKNSEILSDEKRLALIKGEIGDTFHALLNLCQVLDIDPANAFWDKLSKTKEKYAPNEQGQSKPPNYKYLHDKHGYVIASAKALIYRKEDDGKKYLLIREKVGQDIIVDLPGGKMEYGESPEKTLKREVLEEVDLKVKIEKYLGSWPIFDTKKRMHVLCNTYLCGLQGNEKIDLTKNPADEEIVGTLWLTRDEILKKYQRVFSKDLSRIFQEEVK